MTLIILTIGCTLFFGVGIALSTWAIVEIQEDGLDVKNIITFLFGLGITVFGFFCVYKASVYYKENEVPKTEITTSIPPQIDTIVTIKNSVSDTTYVYRFNNLTEK